MMQYTNTIKEKAGIGTNPVIKKLQNAVVKEETSTCATYMGVVAKTVYFLVLTAAGIALYYILQRTLAGMGASVVNLNSDVGQISLSMQAVWALGGAAILTLVTAIMSAFIPALVPVTGTLYVLAEGYLLAFISDALKPEYRWMSVTALLLTLALVLTLLLLYCSKKIRVSHKFRTIISAVFLTLIVGAALMFLISIIPGLRGLSEAVSAVMANPVISIGLSVVFVFVACLFLISDFDAVRELVENRMDKKYEWSCAFGIAYTVLYLYLKILGLLIEIFAKKSE